MKKMWRIVIVLLLGISVAGLAAYRTLPVFRVGVHSQLVMLGDLNSDHHWDEKDAVALLRVLDDPFLCPVLDVVKVDANRNGRLDPEDMEFLQRLYRCRDPYSAEAEAIREARSFPRPREWFRYIPDTEYVKRPTLILDHPARETSSLSFLNKGPISDECDYVGQLRQEIYNEGIRFTLAYNRRKNNLTEVERAYATRKIAEVNNLAGQDHDFDLLLTLMGMTEDAETLKAPEAGSFMGRLLYCRDHLRDLLRSPLYKDFETRKATYRDVFKKMEAILTKDLNISIDLELAPPPRNLLQPRNYIQRALWQFFKSSSRREEFVQLVLYAQYDPRYLRAVSRTSRPHQDLELQNHNLPMVLLFREALRIKKGDKKAAVGLIDEAIRIPFAWVKRIPREKLPSSVALDNFLLPGSKEDGADKSRHWNVFGGISLYKSPEESMLLALAREIKDAREANYTPEALTEFIRDTIANMNGIYHVVLIDPAAAQ
jgi:hypothetical protein